MEILDVFFDRFVLVGNLKKEAESNLQVFLNNHGAKILKVGTSRVTAQLYAENVYIEYDALQGKAFNKGNFRIDYNPQKLKAEYHQQLITTLKPMLHDLHYTRLDLAFDCDFNLSHYKHVHATPVKSTMINSAIGAIETWYHGSRNSDFYSRTYNKKLERKENDGFDKWGQLEHWWRFEMEMKNRNTIETMIALDFPIFERVKFKKLGYEQLTGIDRIVVQGLVENPELEAELSQYQRAKYRKVMNEMLAEDLTPMFEQKLKNKLPQLKRELSVWQPIPSFNEIMNKRWI